MVKFRAWDKKNKCWRTDGLLYIDDEGDLYEIEERSRSYETYMHYENVSDEYELSLFTGLNDKNGKEIYEGDILSNGYHINWIVFFDESSFKVKHTLQPINQKWVLDHSMSSSREVIGNIYENSELIGDNNA